MTRHDIATIGSTAVVTVGLAVMGHEAGHIVAGTLAGGHPAVMTATEVLGDFTMLSPRGFVALGVSGSVVNLSFCLWGAWTLRRRPAGAALRLAAWYAFAVNGMLVATAMAGESLVAFGDWMTILRPFGATPLERGVFAVLGIAGIAFMVRRTGTALAEIVPPGNPPERAAEARRIVWIGAAVATLLVIGGSIAGPVATTRRVLLAVTAGLGPFIPLAFGLRFVGRTPSLVTDAPAPGGWRWIAAAGAVIIALWFVVGPGLPLSAVSP